MSGQEMAKEAGTTQFDPDIIEALCQAINKDKRQDVCLALDKYI